MKNSEKPNITASEQLKNKCFKLEDESRSWIAFGGGNIKQ